MTEATHSRNAWAGTYLADLRPILSAFPMADASDPCANAFALRAEEGWVFERFERPGEMAMLPYLRATKDGVTFEAPLTRFAWVRFAEEPHA